MNGPQSEQDWAIWMRAAIAGDVVAYRRLLQAVAPHLRALARRGCTRAGMDAAQAEDIVQEVLLAIHLKRGTWDSTRPIGPWLSTIVRNKVTDAMRRRRHAVLVPIDEVADWLPADAAPEPLDRRDAERMLERLREPQRDIVRSISVHGGSIRETAARLCMTEGAVRVALHRALKSLAALYRSETS